MPSDYIIRPSFLNAILFFFMPLGFSRGSAQWVTLLSFAITMMLYTLLKSQMQDLYYQLNRAFFLLNLLLVTSNSKYYRAISI